MKEKIALVGRGYAGDVEGIFPELTAGEGQVRDYLKDPKSKKFMGKQDMLAVVALGRALENFSLSHRENTGVYLSVGPVPFAKRTLEQLARYSTGEEGEFSIEEFTTRAIRKFNPLLSFRCLPNMPAYHLSANFSLQGPSYITHPGVGAFYQCLERAAEDLAEGTVETAVVGGTAHLDNFLSHFRLKIEGKYRGGEKGSAAVVLLKRESRARAEGRRIYFTLEDFHLELGPGGESFCEELGGRDFASYLGPASLGLLLNTDLEEIRHRGENPEGFRFSSRWRKG